MPNTEINFSKISSRSICNRIIKKNPFCFYTDLKTTFQHKKRYVKLHRVPCNTVRTERFRFTKSNKAISVHFLKKKFNLCPQRIICLLLWCNVNRSMDALVKICTELQNTTLHLCKWNHFLFLRCGTAIFFHTLIRHL